MGYLSSYTIKDVILPIEKSNSKQAPQNTNPKISIITASYNQGQFLERTILSVINQNYSNFELIIIDGGSTDESVEIIKKYEEYISYWVSEKDNGQADAINKGLKMATGKLLCFQNSDDIFYANSFKLLAEFHQEQPDFDCYFGDLLFIDAADNTLEILKTSKFDIKAQILEGMQVFNQSLYFTKKIAEKHGYLDEKLSFVLDYENILRWAYNRAQFTKVPKLIGAFRIHEDAKTNQLQAVRQKEHEIVKKKYFDLVFANKKPSKIVYILLRLKKMAHFVFEFDFGYIFYRYSLKK